MIPGLYRTEQPKSRNKYIGKKFSSMLQYNYLSWIDSINLDLPNLLISRIPDRVLKPSQHKAQITHNGFHIHAHEQTQ